MSILQMRYFLVLAKYENLAKAAEELQVSPSALSKSISRLEEEVGIKLFDRGEQGLTLNSAGLIARDTYMQILSALDNMYIQLEEMSDNERQRINIIAISNLSAAKLITGFKKEYPRCLIHFREASFQEISRADMNSQYDFMIAGEEFISDGSLNSQLIEGYVPMLMVPTGHAFVGKKVTLEDIAACPLITSPSSSAWGKYVDSIFRDRGLKTTSIASATYGMRCQMVASGLGVSIASGNSVLVSPPGGNVEIVEICDTFPVRNLYLYWSRARQPSKVMLEFRDYALRRLSKEES